MLDNADHVQPRESLVGSSLLGEVVEVTFDKTLKRGEARVRVPDIHGTVSETADEDLPVATFFPMTTNEEFGTFSKGDKVIVAFDQGARTAPRIKGKILDMDAVSEVVPEYGEKYGQVKGLMSKAIGAAIFFDEEAGCAYIRFKDGGSSFKVTDGLIEQKTGEVKIITSGATSIQAGGAVDVEAGGNATVKASGNANVEAGGVLTLKGSMIMEN